jgi:hypothetical protein
MRDFRKLKVLLSHELDVIGVKDFEKLTADVVEVKRMLTAFTQRLTAER